MKQPNLFTSVRLFFSCLFFFLYLSAQAQWQPQAVNTIPAGYNVWGLSVVSDKVVWAVSNKSFTTTIPTDHIGKVLRSTDGGQTWQVQDIEEAVGRVSWDIQAFDSLTAWIISQDYNNGSGRGLFKTTDGGATWVKKFDGLAGGVWVRFFDTQHGMAINNNNFIRTEDGGETWQNVTPPTFLANEFTLLSSGLNSCTVKDNYIWFGTDKGRIARSSDRGKTWQFFNSGVGATAKVLSVAFKDTLNGMANAYTTQRNIITTKDGGKTWQRLSGNINSVGVINLAYVPGTDNTYIGGPDIYEPIGNRISAYTTDFGNSWRKIGTGPVFGAFQFYAPGIGWATNGLTSATQPAAVYKWGGNPLVSTLELPNKLGTVDFSPNPTQDMVHIRQLPAGTDWQANLIDQSGRTVKTVALGNTGEAHFSIAELPDGPYFLQLTGGDAVATGKIVKGGW